LRKRSRFAVKWPGQGKRKEKKGNGKETVEGSTCYLSMILFRLKPGNMGKNRNNSKSRSYPGGGMYSKWESGLFEARVKVFFPRSRVWKLA
jgi:hypothetical protein